jgi:hypothetical protein
MGRDAKMVYNGLSRIGGIPALLIGPWALCTCQPPLPLLRLLLLRLLQEALLFAWPKTLVHDTSLRFHSILILNMLISAGCLLGMQSVDAHHNKSLTKAH